MKFKIKEDCRNSQEEPEIDVSFYETFGGDIRIEYDGICVGFLKACDGGFDPELLCFDDKIRLESKGVIIKRRRSHTGEWRYTILD